ncbi:MAG TPA: peptidoglycan editing factor PgeF [Streptosporangiaceae bacterium]|nr:peptidoglycan editing factor PgeF [Streptosporangiaceae bacterium]
MNDSRASGTRLSVWVDALAPGARYAFTGRCGGLSQPPYQGLNLSAATGDDPDTVARNRQLLAAACGLPVEHLIWMRQVHGADVGEVTGPSDRGSAPSRDASFTSVPGLAQGALAADCPVVLLADPDAKIVGAAHSGRKGTVAGVTGALVAAMCRTGADPGRMYAVISPAICGGCYEVPDEMRDSVAAAVPGSGCLTRAGTPGLDLRAGIAGQLAAAGVRRVRVDPRCTAETPDLYSYRRDGRTGRFAGLVWLAP